MFCIQIMKMTRRSFLKDCTLFWPKHDPCIEFARPPEFNYLQIQLLAASDQTNRELLLAASSACFFSILYVHNNPAYVARRANDRCSQSDGLIRCFNNKDGLCLCNLFSCFVHDFAPKLGFPIFEKNLGFLYKVIKNNFLCFYVLVTLKENHLVE